MLFFYITLDTNNRTLPLLKQNGLRRKCDLFISQKQYRLVYENEWS